MNPKTFRSPFYYRKKPRKNPLSPGLLSPAADLLLLISHWSLYIGCLKKKRHTFLACNISFIRKSNSLKICREQFEDILSKLWKYQSNLIYIPWVLLNTQMQVKIFNISNDWRRRLFQSVFKYAIHPLTLHWI